MHLDSQTHATSAGERSQCHHLRLGNFHQGCRLEPLCCRAQPKSWSRTGVCRLRGHGCPPAMATAGINVVRTYTPITDLTVLDTLWAHGIFAILTVFYDAGYGDTPESATAAVCAVKHRAPPPLEPGACGRASKSTLACVPGRQTQRYSCGAWQTSQTISASARPTWPTSQRRSPQSGPPIARAQLQLHGVRLRTCGRARGAAQSRCLGLQRLSGYADIPFRSHDAHRHRHR